MSRRLGAAAAGVVVTVVAGLAIAPAALAVPDCATPLPKPIPVLTGQGSMESVIVDARGRLFYSDSAKKAIVRLDAPGAAPVVLHDGIDAPGGLAFDADGKHLFVGEGDSLQGGLSGNLQPAARLLRMDTDTGATTVFASGLRMANGLARAADGALYASSDLGLTLDRIGPDGTLTRDWASVPSGNGMAIDSAQTALFVNQTFVPAAIARVDLDKPAKVTTYFRATGADMVAGLDGMTIDPQNRLVVAANALGEVWRVGMNGTACALGRGLMNTSAVAYGHGPTGFSEGRLFAVGFDGRLVEIPGGRLDTAPTVTATVVRTLPRSARVTRGRIRVTFRLTRNGRPVRATVSAAGREVRTGRRVVLRVGSRLRTLRAEFRPADGQSVIALIPLRRG